jgi:hypothetical protein
MKTTKTILGALGMAALFALSARAQTVNNDFEFTGAMGIYEYTYAAPGAASDTGTVWNQNTVDATQENPTSLVLSGLTNSTGGPSSVVLTISDPGTIGIGASATLPAISFLSTWFSMRSDGSGGGATFTYSGLTPGDNYNVFVYAETGTNYNATSSFTLGLNTQTATNSNSDTGFVDNGNYVEFANVTADLSGDINFTGASGGAISGFQLQAESVPEPSALALLGLGGLGLAFLIRRHRTA